MGDGGRRQKVSLDNGMRHDNMSECRSILCVGWLGVGEVRARILRSYDSSIFCFPSPGSQGMFS